MKVFDIIKYSGNNDTFVWKFPGEDFNTLSQLIVSESQEAVFFKDGKALDLFGAGKYTMHTQNIPLLRRLVNLPFNGESPFSCQVYFINKIVSMDVLWGTASPIPLKDPVENIILKIRANGQFAVRVADSKKLLLTMVGTIDRFDQDTLRKYFKGILQKHIKDSIAKAFVIKHISVLEISAHLTEISEGIGKLLEPEFSKYGLELVNFNVSEITPVEDENYKVLQRGTNYVYLEKQKTDTKKYDMTQLGYNYQQARTFNVLDTAAANEGAGANIMGAGMGLGMGMNVGGAIGGAMAGSMANISPNMQPQGQTAQSKCPVCGEAIPENSKFCLSCGTKIEEEKKDMVTCPKCGASVPNGKFCLECGAKLNPVCPKCGANIVPNAKFCLECGNKLE
ncbi:MAG: SPFH domain-containing protein [Firmicutes bacterium]|nr:SPFH domain-containing protein [Bacillota bacterium]